MAENFEKNGSDPSLAPPAEASFYHSSTPHYPPFQDPFYFHFPSANPFQMVDEISGFLSQSLSLNAGDHDKVSAAAARSPSGGAASGNDMSSNESSPTTPRFRYDGIRGDLGLSHLGDFTRAYHHPEGEAFPNECPREVYSPNLLRPAKLPLSQTRSCQKVKYNFCVFCKNNGEDERFYLSHTLKDDNGYISCPILYNYKCPICGATGHVSHTIRYCPQNRDDKYHADFASITVMKQLRSSTGAKQGRAGGPPGIIGQQLLPSIPPSKRLPAMRHLPPSSNSALRGPNAAWTGSTTQPCMMQPMFGELVNQQERERRDRHRAATSELCNFAQAHQSFLDD